ncbi:MAG: D-TA family PLP-dependent enzyme, partial [Spirochaetaceae bacterium]
MSSRFWFEVDDVAQLRTPALVFYRDRIDANIAAAIGVAGDPVRLRPHVKTHKCSQIVSMMLARDITKYKCATIEEAAMLARAGVRDVMVAYPPAGPAAADFVDLTRTHPDVRFRITVDSPVGADAITTAAHDRSIEVLVDLNVGMNRTGIAIGQALDFYRALASTGVVVPTGLHAYDGHVHDVDPAERCARTTATVAEIRRIER